MTARHAATAERWHTFTLMQQLAHIGSEVERVLNAHDSGNSSRLDHALARALELFDLTASDERWRGARRREILRAREEVCRVTLSPDAQKKSADGLRRYFLSFAVAARRSSRA